MVQCMCTEFIDCNIVLCMGIEFIDCIDMYSFENNSPDKLKGL